MARGSQAVLVIKVIFLFLLFSGSKPVSSQENSLNYKDFYSGGEFFRHMEDFSPFSGINWNSIGPSFQGGRVETIDCPLDQPGVIYAGFGSGSLWKTTNQGFEWDCIFQNEYTQSIGDLAISVSNPDVLYLGTGENLRASRGYSLPGAGVYKSTDGGQNWYNIGLTDSHHIGRIVIDPKDANLVFVAAIGHFWSKNEERGLFMTKDGGHNWEKILYISDSTGVVDVAWDSKNQILYAAGWDMVSGSQSGIYKSEDLGDKWERCDIGFPASEGVGRIGLAISSSRPEIIYALVDNRNQSSSKEGSEIIGAEVYRSNNFGQSWEKTHKNPIDNYSGFGWAFGDIRVSPFDHKEVYILGVYLMRSQDGGQSFSRMDRNITHINPNPGKTLHLDQHDLYIDPLHSDLLILGNNGGLYLTYDKGKSWTHCNTIPVAEFYDISVVDGDTVRIYGGTQDNSSLMGSVIPEDHRKLLNSWEYVWLDPWSGGDAFSTYEIPQNSNKIIYESQNGYLSIKDMLSGETRHIKPSPDQDENPLRNSWFTPYFISEHDKKTIYYGANKVYKSIDMGDSWIRLSPDLCYSKNDDKKSRSITAVAESPLSAGLIFAGTEKGIVWVSRNDGTRWIEISDGIPDAKIIQIVPSRHLSSRVYIVAKGMDNDNYSPMVFLSENTGKTWNLISKKLPYESVNCLIEDPVLKDLIYVGTDRSIYCTPDKGLKWESLGKNLPTTSVHQLRFVGSNKYIIAATHGMSLFMAHTEPIRTYYASSNHDQPLLLAGIDGKLPQMRDFSGDFDLESIRKMQLSFLWPNIEDVFISLFNDNGESIIKYEYTTSMGVNQWSWDLIIEHRGDKSLYPVPEITFPEPGYYNITIEGPSGKANGPVRIFK